MTIWSLLILLTWSPKDMDDQSLWSSQPILKSRILVISWYTFPVLPDNILLIFSWHYEWEFHIFYVSSHMSSHDGSYLRIETTSLTIIYIPYVHHSPKGQNTYWLKRYVGFVKRDMSRRQNILLESEFYPLICARSLNNFLFLKIYEHKIYFGFLYRGGEGIWWNKEGEHIWKLKCHPCVSNNFEKIIAKTIGGGHLLPEISILIYPYRSGRHYFNTSTDVLHIKESPPQIIRTWRVLEDKSSNLAPWFYR